MVREGRLVDDNTRVLSVTHSCHRYSFAHLCPSGLTFRKSNFWLGFYELRHCVTTSLHTNEDRFYCNDKMIVHDNSLFICSGRLSSSTTAPTAMASRLCGRRSHGMYVTPRSTSHRLLNSDSLIPTLGAQVTYEDSQTVTFLSHTQEFTENTYT